MNDADRKLEEKLADLGLPGPRVTPAMVEEILATVTYSTRVVEGTTSTIAVAILPSGFVLATGMAACVARENFNPALGVERAISKARDLAREAIWQHEGYRLSQALQEVSTGKASAALSQIRAVLGTAALEPRLTASAWANNHRHDISLPQRCANGPHLMHCGALAGSAGSHDHSGFLSRQALERPVIGMEMTVDAAVPADTVAVIVRDHMTAIRTGSQDAGASE